MMNTRLDRSIPPAPGPAPRVHPGAHSTFNLPNGMRAIVVQNHKLPLVSLQVRFDIPPVMQGERTGYVDLLGELLMAGTMHRNKSVIDETVDRLGASLHTTSEGLFASCLKRNFSELMDLVQEVLMEPSFPEVEFEKARTRMLSAVLQRTDDPDAIAGSVGRLATFGADHPYGELVTASTLDGITVDHLFAYYSHYFDPERGYLVFVGDITEQEARQLALARFGSWVPARSEVVQNADGSQEVPGLGTVRVPDAALTPSGRRRVVLVDRPGAGQSVIRVAYPVDLHPRNRMALEAQVMNSILGGGVFNARLMQNLREEKGWTYGVHSTLESDRFNGNWTAAVSVRTEVTDKAVQEIVQEMERMIGTEVSTEELELTKNHMAGSFGRSLEDPRTVARFALNTQLCDLSRDHYTTYLQRLEAVTKADVQQAARLFLHPSQAVVLIVGDKKALMDKLVHLSEEPIMELDANGVHV